MDARSSKTWQDNKLKKYRDNDIGEKFQRKSVNDVEVGSGMWREHNANWGAREDEVRKAYQI